MALFQTASSDRYELLKAFARENRKNPTMAEQILWTCIRDKALGTRFLRQHIIDDFIVDFVSLENSFVIEVDGSYHAEREQMEKDDVRTDILG